MVESSKTLLRAIKYLQDSSVCYISLDDCSEKEKTELFAYLDENEYNYANLEQDNVVKIERKL